MAFFIGNVYADNKKTAPEGGRIALRRKLHRLEWTGLLLAEGKAAEAGIELDKTAAAVEQLLRAAGPGRMGVRIDVEVQGAPSLP